MSVLVSTLTNNNHNNHHHHHHNSSFFSNNTNRRINGNISQIQQNRLTTNTLNEHDQDSDHVPFGVVNSMKQRLLNKVNESYVLNNNSTLVRHSLLKQSARIASNENLLQTKTSLSPLKRTTRLSRSQDNLTNNNNNNNNNSINYISAQIISTEQFTSYIQPKQDVIIVDTTTNSNHIDDNNNDGKLRAGQKTLSHRQSYTELHVDEAPKPGTVTTVKNMFERQIRLSRYDADKLINAIIPGNNSRLNSQHRDISSPTRSRSTSPNDMAIRQRRTTISGSILPSSSSTTLSLPVSSSYPDLVISHTPPAETNKNSNEQIHNENHTVNNQVINKEKKISNINRNLISHEHIPLSVIIDECSSNQSNNHRPNLLLPSKLVSETVDCQPLDFKSRLALFNRTNTQRINENSINIKKSFNQTNSLSTNLLTKPIVQHSTRLINEEKKDTQIDIISHPVSIPISRSVVNTANAVTFFGGNKVNGNTKSSLPDTILPPPPPQSSSSSAAAAAAEINIKKEQSTSIDLQRAPDIIGGNIKLNKSSIFSGAKKNIRVQFIDDVDTFEYPSFEVVMAEHGSNGSDDDNDMEVNDNLTNVTSNGDNNHNIMKNNINGKTNDKEDELNDNNNQVDDVDDDELERLARINAEFNTNNLTEKPLKPKGTLHTFRPTHLDQYELGTQHGSLTISKSSDTSSTTNSYSILARQKLQSSSDTSTKTSTNHSLLKQQKSNFDMTNNVQWSSMSTTTDLLF
ncbi:unnamed protein product [Rotaria sordida]|uniref:Uncharacterized protein n=1 Tax=Rotaria sordida TaxID=392033 RepID=A0A813Y310_9BILA|nr:unnamed protein product [Rotaria sordida]CAF1438557.1 unnamed protein product [Rotaria sordida]